DALPIFYSLFDYLYICVLNYYVMSQYYVYIHLEKYLAEWLLHQFGQNGQIRFPRGSAENDILE
ncbi:hypothetical protein, partial [Barnesiella intestinihominis]|uniref:hypothetical protein n=1 Tax=Barnesiella intestinihominis TaxID=487174 RepID=UPI0039678605